jgi:transposase
MPLRRCSSLQSPSTRVSSRGVRGSFAAGLNAIGTVNRIKMIIRQMFGRANFDPLGKRVLLAT